MKAPVLEFEALDSNGGRPRHVRCAPGSTVHFSLAQPEAALSLVDELLLLETPRLARKVSWFGRAAEDLHWRERAGVRRRCFVIVPGAPLISNISLAENILLPALARGGKQESLARRLLDWMEKFGASHGLSADDLVARPHESAPRLRAVASVLQAWLAAPDMFFITSCGCPWPQAWDWIGPLCLWLHEEAPSAAWLFINSESSLPAEFPPHNLDDAQ